MKERITPKLYQLKKFIILKSGTYTRTHAQDFWGF